MPDKKIKLEDLIIQAPEVAIELGRLTIGSEGMPFVVKTEYEILLDDKGNKYVNFNGRKFNLNKIYKR
tara:strand:+ start:57 stop:260 length:204 start_codon:yes stop_codon:yes gene_type:complete